jgi:CRISPR-associated protein Cmr6
VRPLYKAASDQPSDRVEHGNASLWFDKFCNTWPGAKSWTLTANEPSNPKLDWINKTLTHRQVGVEPEIREAALRLLRLTETRGGWVGVFETQSRFVSGLGRSHPIENGFAWHPTLGVPCLPGSSIKGMALAWARETGMSEDDRDRIFGAPDRAGSVCFLDAIPTQPVRLEADVITPHYAGWDAANLPGDWRSPTPIPFLATAKGTPFLFGVVPRARATAGDAERAMILLAEALKITGAGAKTAVGYGRMARDEDKMQRLLAVRRQQDDELRERERMARLTPLERELADLPRRNKGQDAYITWLQELEKGRWADDPASRAEVLKRIQEEMKRSGKWKPESNAKRLDKDRLYQNTCRVLDLMKGESQS